MYDIRYSVNFDDKEEVFEEYTSTAPMVFSFYCCKRFFEIEIEEIEVGIYKDSCESCGKTAVIEIEQVINYDDPETHFEWYLRKELEKDD